MKQTNNAIKFLMAQYRAIFQNAYFKGLATAAVVTMGLAAGQAQATPTVFSQDSAAAPTITINGVDDAAAPLYTKIGVTASSDAEKFANTEILINKGTTASDNSIAGDATGTTFKAKKITIDVGTNDAATHGLKVLATTGNATVQLTELDVTKGTLDISATATGKSAKVAANTISVGETGTISIGSHDTESSLGTKDTTYTLASGSTLSVGKSGSVLGNISDAAGVNIKFTDAGTLKAHGTNVNANISVTAQKTGTIDLVDTESKTLALSAGKITIHGDSGTVGKLEVASGTTLSLAPEVQVVGDTADKGTLSIVDGATLKAGATQIKSFLNAASNKGILSLAGTWELQGTGDDLDIGGLTGGTAAGNVGGLATTTFIKGQNITVSDDLNTFTNANIVAADTLTLGKDDTAAKALLGGATVIAKDLVLKTSDDGFNLQDNITLTAVSGADSAEQADSVTLEDKIVLNKDQKGLTIKGGNYTANDVTVGAGTLTVTKHDKVGSTLTINKLVLDNSQNDANGKISVSGNAADVEEVTLDLTNTDISYATTDTSAAKKYITLEADKGTIKIAGDKITGLLGDSTLNGAVFNVTNGGQLLVTEGLELDAASQLKTSGVTTSGIMLDNGKLNVDGELKLSNAKSVSFDKDDNSVTLQAKKLSLNLAASDVAAESATLKSGDFIVTEQLSTNSDKGIVISDNGLLKLGDKNTSAGNIYANSLKVAGTAQAAQLDVVKGTWSLAGKTELGAHGTVNVESGAGLNTQELVVSDAGANFNLKDGATSSVTKLTATAGKVNVSGEMTVEGAITKSGTTITSHGVELADDSIQMAATGKLSFGEAATQAITVKKDGVDVFTGSFADGGAIKSIAGSEVSFSFDETTNFTADALKALRTKIFGVTGDKLVEGRINLGKATIAGIDENIVENKISWDKVEGLSDSIGDTTSEKLSQAIVTDVTSADKIRGHYGAIQSNDTGAINIVGNTSLNNAAANNGMFAQGIDQQPSDFNVATGTLELNNGGQAGKVTLSENTTLQVDGAQTTIEAIEGKKASVILAQGATTVTNNANIKNFKDVANSSLTVGKKLILGEGLATDQKTTILGSVKAGSADFKADALVKGNLEVTAGDLVASKSFEASGNLTVSGASTFKGKATLSGAQNNLGVVTFEAAGNKIAQGQTFASDIKLGNNAIDLVVGTDPTDALPAGASAYLVTNKLTLNDGDLYIDPSYNVESSIVIANELSNADPATLKTDAGSLGGSVVALQNSIFAVGLDTTDKAAALASVKSELAPLFKANGALDKDNVGSVAYISKKITLGATDQLVVDSSKSLTAFNNADQAYKDIVTTNDIVLGANSALAVDGSAFGNGKAAITLADGSKIYSSQGSKVILTGKDAMDADHNKLFGNQANDLTLTGTGKLTVQTINGWFTTELTNTNLNQVLDLEIDHTKAVSDLAVVSEPVKDTLLSAAYDFHNYEEYLAKKADGSWDKDTMPQDVLGVVAPSNITYDKDNQKILENGNDITSNTARLTELGIDVDATKKHGIVYLDATNALLENILYSNGNAVDAETNARLAVFGGAPQAAIEAGASTYEAISARMGVGVSGVSAAANGQGGAIWVTPVYKSAESDGFAADNKSYGADVKLYGLALGADIEVAPNFKVGGMFNVGSGDADGQGLGANVSNDFDYYGLGLYAGYSMDAFSLVADVTYTAVDNDIEGNTDLGKVNASIDSTNLSVGVTGQYKLSLAGMDVTPHAGLRYSMIDMDDYSTAYSQNDSDSLNIFSVPVGVTIAKEYVTDTWTVKPSFDLTLTGNFGDDEVDATAKWNGFSNLSTTVKSEIMDNFTYGAAVGVSATSGNFGLGLGVNYTGSSNTDEFGVNANARYMF